MEDGIGAFRNYIIFKQKRKNLVLSKRKWLHLWLWHLDYSSLGNSDKLLQSSLCLIVEQFSRTTSILH